MNELLLRFLDDRASLSETEAQELSAWLEANPEALAELRAQLVMDELLSRRAGESRAVFVARVRQALPVSVAEEEAGAPFIATVLRRLGLGAAPARAHPWRWLAAGACAALLAAMAFIFLRSEAPRVRLATMSGDVRVWREQVTMIGKPGFVLQAGDWLLTGKDGAAEVEFPGETTRLAIGADAEFGVVTAQLHRSRASQRQHRGHDHLTARELSRLRRNGRVSSAVAFIGNVWRELLPLPRRHAQLRLRAQRRPRDLDAFHARATYPVTYM